jgi:hypothetical protein
VKLSLKVLLQCLLPASATVSHAQCILTESGLVCQECTAWRIGWYRRSAWNSGWVVSSLFWNHLMHAFCCDLVGGMKASSWLQQPSVPSSGLFNGSTCRIGVTPDALFYFALLASFGDLVMGTGHQPTYCCHHAQRANQYDLPQTCRRETAAETHTSMSARALACQHPASGQAHLSPAQLVTYECTRVTYHYTLIASSELQAST